MMLTCRDIIEIVNMYNQSATHPKRQHMSQYIRNHSKSYIVEEIDSLSNKDILSLLELFRNDIEFKKFLAHNLKEKIIQTPNMPIRELMTAVVETIDLEDMRGEIMRYALNSEVFYAFPVSYLISLLKKISYLAPFHGHVGLAGQAIFTLNGTPQSSRHQQK